MFAGVPEATGPRAVAALVAATAKAAAIKRNLRIAEGPRRCAKKLCRPWRKAQAAAVAKLIQSFDNSRSQGPRTLPASPAFTYHKVQFGKVAFAVPRQS